MGSKEALPTPWCRHPSGYSDRLRLSCSTSYQLNSAGFAKSLQCDSRD
jgi:hypothetical protein